MPTLLPIVLTASHIVLAANPVPKFDIERTCRPAAQAGILPGRDAPACQRDENESRSKLGQDWMKYSATQRANCTSFVETGGAPSYVELLTCLEMAKQAQDLPAESKMGATTGSGARQK